MIFSNLLNGAGHPSANIWISTCSVLASSSLLLIPRYGIGGAALGALCGSGFAALSGFLCAGRFCGVSAANCLLPCKADWVFLYNAVANLIPGREAFNNGDL